jgi:hypothetical protein
MQSQNQRSLFQQIKCYIARPDPLLFEDPLSPPAIEFPVEDLFPGAEVQLSIRDGDHNLPADHLVLEVGIAGVLSSPFYS